MFVEVTLILVYTTLTRVSCFHTNRCTLPPSLTRHHEDAELIRRSGRGKQLLLPGRPAVISFENAPETRLFAGNPGRSSPRGGDRSKRQERVGHLVRTELSGILHRGIIKGDAEYLEDELRQRISVVNADISPDLRQARVSVSILAPKKVALPESAVVTENPLNVATSAMTASSSAAVDKRRAYAWLVRNTKPIRHTLAQRLRHMKTCPTLTFVQVDLAAAVDVMYLIDKVSKGYTRESIDLNLDEFGDEFDDDEDAVPSGIVDGLDFDEELDDDEDWVEEEEEEAEGNEAINEEAALLLGSIEFESEEEDDQDDGNVGTSRQRRFKKKEF